MSRSNPQTDPDLSPQVGLAWVLNQLAGMKFPEQGGAYDFIKKSWEASLKAEREENPVLDGDLVLWWHVVRLPGGHYEAKSVTQVDGWDLPAETEVVDWEELPYLEACRRAAALNDVAEVIET